MTVKQWLLLYPQCFSSCAHLMFSGGYFQSLMSQVLDSVIKLHIALRDVQCVKSEFLHYIINCSGVAWVIDALMKIIQFV